MSIWLRISKALASLANGESLSMVFSHLRSPPERRAGFAIAVIALSAKMAKADGLVTRDEVSAFREVFRIDPADEAGAARVFNLARQDVAGFELYAKRISAMFGTSTAPLCDLLEGLFHIALADGSYHPLEDGFLWRVADIFGLTEAQFNALRARLVPGAVPDPYAMLGVTPDMPMDEIRKHYRRLVKECHPDIMSARGVPKEALALSQKKLAAINAAWDEIRSENGNAL